MGNESHKLNFNKLTQEQISLICDISSSDTLAELYRKRAVDAIYQFQNYDRAMELINAGLAIADKDTEPFLYDLRYNLLLILNQDIDALKDMNVAIRLYIDREPSDYKNIIQMYDELFYYYYHKKHFGLAEKAINIAIELAEELDIRTRNHKLFLLFKSRAKLNELIGNGNASLIDVETSKKYETLHNELSKNDVVDLPF